MSEDDGTFEPVIARLLKSIEEMETQLVQKKRLVNELCREYGRPPRFMDVDAPRPSMAATSGRDVYYGRPLATVMREVMELRGPSNKGELYT